MGVPANRIFIHDNGDTLEMRNGKELLVVRRLSLA